MEIDFQFQVIEQVCEIWTLQNGVWSVKELINKEDYMGKLDLKGAYLSIPIHNHAGFWGSTNKER